MVTYGGRPKTERVPVEVIARVGANGHVTPIRILWPDGRRFDIQVVRRDREYDRKARTTITDYTVEIPLPSGHRRTTHVWYDGRQFWVEKKAR